MTPAERKYFNAMKLVAKEIEKILKSTLTSATKAQGIKAISLLKKYSKTLTKWSNQTVATMFYNVDKDNKKKWDKLSAKMSQELKKELSRPPEKAWMQKYMDDNVGFIKSMPIDAAKRVHKLIKENQYVGLRSTDLIDEIMRIGGMSENKAKMIARTETSRYSTALTEMRATSIGADWYIWRAVGDFRTRSSHKHMNRVLVSWNDPPSPEKLSGEKAYGEYHAGETFNCRCYPEVLILSSDISWPAKVYFNGRTQQMNQRDFEKLVKITNRTRRAA
jgi:SPP1 gp7 family putative phage head morphogenesis protein